MQAWRGKSCSTLIGSMPHRDPDKAIELVLRAAPEIPVWPQLPAFRAEQMMIQFLEGLPGIYSEPDRIVVRTESPDFENELYEFYEEYLEVEGKTRDVNDSRFQMGPETARTFYRFLETLSPLSPDLAAVKGQVVGPFTLLAGLKDERDRLVLYDDRMRDAVTKHLAMKCSWQIKRLKALDCPVIIFLDEPALAGFGSSAFISVSQELIQSLLREVLNTVHDQGGLMGIHVCANTDWRIAFDSGVDIISFDAYSYFEKFALYKDEFNRFLARGGNIAWGMTPTIDPEVIWRESSESLVGRWLANIEGLTTPDCSIQRILSQSLFTPSCGCGSLQENVAERVLEMTRGVSEIMRSHI